MKALVISYLTRFTMLGAAIGLAAIGCGGQGGGPGGNNGGNNQGGDAVSVGGLVKSSTTWSAAKVHTLTRPTVVAAPAVLTIEAGTTIKGAPGSYLLVARGAKLVAEGTAERPIVFTSASAVGSRRPGDWGGVVLLGKATINVAGGQNAVEGLPAGLMLDGEPVDTRYGGSDDEDSSGSLRYVRVEFAGFELSPDNELNGLTLAGVGRGTTIDFIQSHKGADDAIEIFGGTVNLKHVVATSFNDDGLDVDLGYRGKVQFMVLQQDPGSNTGYEWDNNKNDNDALPRTAPEVWNVTMVGSKKPRSETQQEQQGMVLRRGAAGHLGNHVIMGFQLQAADVRDAATVANCQLAMTAPQSLHLRGSLVFENGASVGGDFAPEPGAPGLPDNDSGFDEQAFFMKAELANRAMDPRLAAPYHLTAPDFMPEPGSPALTAGVTPPNDGFFDTSATYAGAFGATNWMAGWTAFPAN